MGYGLHDVNKDVRIKEPKPEELLKAGILNQVLFLNISRNCMKKSG